MSNIAILYKKYFKRYKSVVLYIVTFVFVIKLNKIKRRVDFVKKE